MRVSAIAVVSLFLSGCVPQPLYQWGPYEQGLYRSYADPSTIPEFKASLDRHIAATIESGQRVPPGVYAELGTLYLQEGVVGKAIEMYQKEYDAWPESRGLMHVLIENLQRDNEDKDKLGGAGAQE